MHFVEAPNKFYIGARVDPESGQVIPDSPVYFEARDLTTHAVILGMTGSGKTGLGITMLEEAAIDHIPSIVIDTKGDITNLLLAFPEFRPEEFEPWVNPDDATRADEEIAEFAMQIGQRWREGLQEWGIDSQRIRKFKEAVDFTIYTPGSEAGVPISILQSFAAPREGWLKNEERLREHLTGIVTALLGLVGVKAEPIKDREHLLLTNIFEYNWRQGIDLTLNELIQQVQRPPFEKLGVFDVETIFAEKDRFKLAQQLNNLIASPGFQTWLTGESLHIPSLLYTREGKPRMSIFYLAHLNDVERQFIETLLLQEVLAWMRSLSGSTSLRAIVYIDEVFGMFPPHPYNPPTKEPILRLLKQARSFGIGMILSTQNPVDIDYKGLSNTGIWLIGKMQTDNDRRRVLEGLNSAQDAASALDLTEVEKALGVLKQRQFVYHNIHEQNSPTLMQTRWTMSYLRGPLTRRQIELLMSGHKSQVAAPTRQRHPQYLTPQSRETMQEYVSRSEAQYFETVEQQLQPVPAQEAEQAARTSSLALPGFTPMLPEVPSSVQQYYIPAQYTVEQAVLAWQQQAGQIAGNVQTGKRLLYRPSLLAEVQVRFSHAKSNSHQLLWYAFVVPHLPTVPFIDWSEYQTEPFDPRALELKPFAEAYYGEIPPTLRSKSAFTDLQNSLRDWIYQQATLSVYYNPTLKLYSDLDESRHDYVVRLQAAAREAREAEIETVAEKYNKVLEKLEEKARSQAMKLEAQRDQVEGRKHEELLTGAENVWRLMKGNAYRTISRAGQIRREVTTDENRVGIMQEELMALADRLDETEDEMEQKLSEIQEKWALSAREMEEIPVRIQKKDISFIVFGIGWVPYWNAAINDSPVLLPASTAGLSDVQGGLPASDAAA